MRKVQWCFTGCVHIDRLNPDLSRCIALSYVRYDLRLTVNRIARDRYPNVKRPAVPLQRGHGALDIFGQRLSVTAGTIAVLDFRRAVTRNAYEVEPGRQPARCFLGNGTVCGDVGPQLKSEPARLFLHDPEKAVNLPGIQSWFTAPVKYQGERSFPLSAHPGHKPCRCVNHLLTESYTRVRVRKRIAVAASHVALVVHIEREALERNLLTRCLGHLMHGLTGRLNNSGSGMPGRGPGHRMRILPQEWFRRKALHLSQDSGKFTSVQNADQAGRIE
jgi:hypothetical protein